MAGPLARIARRHVPAAFLNEDLADLVAFGAAVSLYAEPAPILVPMYPDAGVPADLQTPPDERESP